MICIRVTAMAKMPDRCDTCIWFGTRPHPHKGWTDLCDLMGHCIDDDQPDEWVFDGNERPKACPLMEVNDNDEN